jgi:hypothetical protein
MAMVRLTHWLRDNADGSLALLIAVTVGLLAVADVLGTDEVNAAILLTLALIAATLLRDRKLAAKALADSTAVRLINGPEVGAVHSQAHRDTEYWMFKGGTGTYLRAVTIKACVDGARRAQRPVRMQVEIVDPTDELLCAQYAQYRSSLVPGPDRTGETWTLDRTRKEAFATILAACWYRQRFTFLNIEVGLSKVMTTFRWDLCSQWVVITQEDPAAPTMLFEKGRPLYRGYSRELVASFEQTRPVPIARAKELQLSEEPSVEETRKLFDLLELSLPGSYTDRDVAEVIRKAVKPKNPYW